MSTPSYESAIFKSVLWVGLPYLIVQFMAGLFSGSLKMFMVYLLGGLFIFFPYLIVSMIGWVTLGFPVHWLICKYAKPELWLYLTGVAAGSGLIYLAFGHYLAVPFAVVAGLQASIFWFYFTRDKNQ